MSTVRSILRNMRGGIIVVIVSLLVGIAIEWLWRPIYGRYGWDVIAVVLMIGAVFAMAGLAEFARPQNPYRHLDPRFSYMDAAPTGAMDSGGLGWLPQATPPLVVALIIIVVKVIF